MLPIPRLHRWSTLHRQNTSRRRSLGKQVPNTGFLHLPSNCSANKRKRRLRLRCKDSCSNISRPARMSLPTGRKTDMVVGFTSTSKDPILRRVMGHLRHSLLVYPTLGPILRAVVRADRVRECIAVRRSRHLRLHWSTRRLRRLRLLAV